MMTGALRLAWDTPLLTPGMGVEGVDLDGASAVAFWEASWEDGWAIAWPDATHRPPQTHAATPPHARLVGVEVSTPCPALISRETSPPPLEGAAILARSGRSTTSREAAAVSHWGCVPARTQRVTRIIPRGVAVHTGLWQDGVRPKCNRGPQGLSTDARLLLSLVVTTRVAMCSGAIMIRSQERK
jgi:hypothetical protein